MPVEILDRWNGSVVYKSDSATTIRDAVLEAARKSANLGGANLSGAYLSSANLRGADLRGAYLRDAYLSGAYLSSANLGGADLRGAYLGGADLRGAYLRGADLRGAYLRDAYLSDAKGINKYLTSPLYMLLDQPGKIRAYKLVTSDLTGPHYPGLHYGIGAHLECDADSDETVSCGCGINLATLDWVMREWSEGYRILVVEHEAKDIAAIPLGTDGKYRVHRCEVVGEKDLEDIGLVTPQKGVTANG